MENYARRRQAIKVENLAWAKLQPFTSLLAHSLPVMPTGTQANKGPPQLSVLSQLLDGTPAVAQAPHLCFDSASPWTLGLPSLRKILQLS